MLSNSSERAFGAITALQKPAKVACETPQAGLIGIISSISFMENPAFSSLFDFNDQVVLITGAAAGIGAGIAQRFGEAGAIVVVHYHTNRQGAEKTAQSILSFGRKVIIAQADLTREDEVEDLVHTAVEAFGGLDVVVNNAGIYPVQTLMEMTLPEWQSVLDANLTSTFLCTRITARQMVAQARGGAIINISSIESQNPTPLHSHYCAAKAAVDQFSRTAANELAQYGIRVNTVAPGLIWREGLEENWPEGVERWLKSVPLKRLGTAADVADACLFLASLAARWVTGGNLVVDGGMLAVQAY